MTERRSFEQILSNTRRRRELLWLLAKKEESHEDAALLESLDPEIAARLSTSGLDVRDLVGERPHERRRRFGRLFEECHARHAASLAACGLPAASSSPWSVPLCAPPPLSDG